MVDRLAGPSGGRSSPSPYRLADIRNVDLDNHLVEVKDQFGAHLQVTLIFERTRVPIKGEVWVLDFSLGFPTLLCPLGTDIHLATEPYVDEVADGLMPRAGGLFTGTWESEAEVAARLFQEYSLFEIDRSPAGDWIRLMSRNENGTEGPSLVFYPDDSESARAGEAWFFNADLVVNHSLRVGQNLSAGRNIMYRDISGMSANVPGVILLARRGAGAPAARVAGRFIAYRSHGSGAFTATTMDIVVGCPAGGGGNAALVTNRTSYGPIIRLGHCDYAGSSWWGIYTNATSHINPHIVDFAGVAEPDELGVVPFADVSNWVTSTTTGAQEIDGSLDVRGSKNAVIADPDDTDTSYRFAAVEADEPGVMVKRLRNVEVGPSREARIAIPEHFARIGKDPMVFATYAAEPQGQTPHGPWAFVNGWDSSTPEVVLRAPQGTYHLLLTFCRSDAGVEGWEHIVTDEPPEDS